MDPLRYLSDETLISFFKSKKNEMSCMKGGLDIFINQLKDGDLMSVEEYKILKQKSKAKRRHMYEFLTNLEERRPQCIRLFWRCVFQEHMLHIYPPLSALKASLQDVNCTLYMENLNAKEEIQNVTTNTPKKRKNSGDEAEQMTPENSFCLPSSLNTPVKKPKICTIKPFVHNQHEIGPSRNTTTEINIEMNPVFSLRTQSEEISQEAKKHNFPVLSKQCLPEHQSISNKPVEEQEKQKKTPIEKSTKNASTEMRKIKKEKLEIPTRFSPDLLKSPLKQKETTININSATDKKSAEEPKQGVKPRPSPLLNEPAFAFDPGLPKSPLKQKATTININSATDKKSAEEPKQGERPQPSPLLIPNQKKPAFGFSHGLPKIPLKQKETTINMNSATDKKSAKEPKQGVKPRPSSLLIPNQKQPAFDDHPETQDFGINNSVKICYICKSVGDLVSCCSCNRSFHNHCHLPNLQDEPQRYSWRCTFCVWKSNKALRQPISMKQALDSPVTSYNMQCEYLLMYMYKEDKQNNFADCAIQAERVIGNTSNLIWLNQVKLKLQNKAYQTVKAFVEDLESVFFIYKYINEEDTKLRRIGFKLRKIFEEKLIQVFDIQ